MPTDTHIEIAARDALARALGPGFEAAVLDPDADMAEDLGLTSLNKVIFLMSVCDDTEVSLSAFTESDVAGMRTLRDVIDALARNVDEGS
ncbi:MAG TPA: acyl carrier protein [Trebonia sp.]|nr:acyl carrier protein [Trebonia sp.]